MTDDKMVPLSETEAFEQGYDAGYRDGTDATMRQSKLIPLSEAQAMIAAALREAAEVAYQWWDDDDAQELRDVIRALIPDAGAALDRALEQAREEGRREGQIKAGAVFATSGAEDRWVDDMANACPACGGSGHKDDAAMAKALAAAADRIEELEAMLEESEARSEVLETLIMDVAADLYDGVPAHKIDQRIGDVMKELDKEEEDQ